MNKLTNISKSAKIGKNLKIDSFSSIHDNVIIGDNCWIGSNVTIYPGARIGSNCKIFPGAVVSGIPQDLKFNGEETTTIIGNGVIIRECVTINRGTSYNNTTIIEDNAYLMAYSHVAHDCIIKNNVIIANGVAIAGHVEIDEYAIIGGLSAIQQFSKIGKFSMISGGSLVRKDVPPYIKVAKEPLRFIGINNIGLKRNNFEKIKIENISSIYRIIFQEGNNISKAIEIIENNQETSNEKKEILKFIKNSKSGIVKGFY
ncbi:MAG: acyl-[acyl-carrier-protein]--UDP-N-acetylglucosamine O-acyltransferase [Flavobacteriales bacterium]|jgi:UDP-N-acetylglucosamine acyltransferase|nr:acyl-[acyl-carrier-protein]--UDP-N-acetylglucosamine O-acyltransferase [Flavobacteriales bacterium]|tara:strand:+ start:742 stop:1515 length:774 start_codon:yes stop_codon:yes gene_type:complete